MTAAIMQPYFLPYLDYFQLISGADVFIVYDNIKYTKQGWVNRNRMLLNGAAETFSLPLKHDSDSLDVRDRRIADDFNPAKLLNKFKGAYQRAPQFASTFPLIEGVVRYEDRRLFPFLLNSIAKVCAHLGITTPIRVSSEIAIDHELRNQDKVLALCQAVGADRYVNPIGGLDLYTREAFAVRGIDLKFLRGRPIEYQQFGHAFVPLLSILDVMMFNTAADIAAHLGSNFTLI
jgi:hypothetical protein